MSAWTNRIVSYGVKPADQFTANPNNPRRHPVAQQRAVAASLDKLGWVAPVIENIRTGYLVDGHERVMQALVTNDPVPYVQVDLSEDEEKTVLLTLDPITGLASYDGYVVDQLMKEVGALDAPLQAMLEAIRQETPLSGESDQFVGGVNKSGAHTLNWGEILVTLPSELYFRVLSFVERDDHLSRAVAMQKLLEAGLSACSQ